MDSIVNACLACLGIRKDENENEETTHLLDQQNIQYGSTMDSRNGGYVDPEEQRRQREELERLCQETSDRLINVAPPTTKPDLDRLAREDGPLFEEVFFKDMDKEEIQRGFQQSGNLNIAAIAKSLAPDSDDFRPIVFDFGR